MWTAARICICVLAVLIAGIDGQTTPQYDQCIDQTFVRFHQALTSKFPQYENFTVSLPSSRHLFQVLLTQNFTADSLKEYCRAYETARKEYDQCADSTYKKASLSGFGLVDYICMKRLDDYANGIACLEKADKAASDICRPKCTQYEKESYSYLHPTDIQNDADMTTYMAGDCQYLKCWTDCRSPSLASQCDNKTAALERDSLIASYSSIHELYEPETGLVPTSPTGQQPMPHFPNECRPFVTAKAGLSDAVIGSSTPATTIVVISGPSTTQTRKLLVEVTTPRGGASRPGAVMGTVASILILWITMAFK